MSKEFFYRINVKTSEISNEDFSEFSSLFSEYIATAYPGNPKKGTPGHISVEGIRASDLNYLSFYINDRELVDPPLCKFEDASEQTQLNVKRSFERVYNAFVKLYS